MGLLLIIAILLILFWGVAVFAFAAGGLIHILLVIAIIVILYRIITGQKVIK